MGSFNYNFCYGESNYGYEIPRYNAWVFMSEVL